MTLNIPKEPRDSFDSFLERLIQYLLLNVTPRNKGKSTDCRPYLESTGGVTENRENFIYGAWNDCGMLSPALPEFTSELFLAIVGFVWCCCF